MNCSWLVEVATAPVPVIGTLCGDPLALSATLSVAVRAPTAPGVNTIEIAQLDPAANVVPQAVVSAKSEALVPATEMAIPVSVAVPVFCRLIIWGELGVPTIWLAKVIDGAENVTIGATPVPARETEISPCGDWIARVPVSAPTAVGLKLTLTVHFAPLARDDPQVLISDQFVDAVMPVMETAEPRLFDSVTGCAVLEVFTSCEPKLS